MLVHHSHGCLEEVDVWVSRVRVKHLDENKVRSLWLPWRRFRGCLEGTGRQAPSPGGVKPFTIFPLPSPCALVSALLKFPDSNYHHQVGESTGSPTTITKGLGLLPHGRLEMAPALQVPRRSTSHEEVQAGVMNFGFRCHSFKLPEVVKSQRQAGSMWSSVLRLVWAWAWCVPRSIGKALSP